MKKKIYDAPWLEVEQYTLSDVIMSSNIPEDAADGYNDGNEDEDLLGGEDPK